ncbi:class I SAM-dependent methyltransferase [Brevibacillus sp. H7]|uniref:class I SAM-dependent methyltransferase n=1 Tax=Brevibacillus sp. H7 TaxID=3349138 RepID=UPI003806AD53
MVQQWNARLYDDNMQFVSQLGKGLLDWLGPAPGEAILDLGCGTGDLTNELAEAGAVPTGIDLSPAMIELAREKYPSLRFLVADAETYRSEESFDGVFSNAALHWMKRPEAVIRTVRHALRPGGRFVAEFGGKGNVGSIVEAIEAVLAEVGIDAKGRNPWYFPSIGEYGALLEQNGFRLVRANHFDRPTQLSDGERGIRHWLDSFAGVFFQEMSLEQKERACERIAETLRSTLFQDGSWVADYKRIRILAVKEKA